MELRFRIIRDGLIGGVALLLVVPVASAQKGASPAKSPAAPNCRTYATQFRSQHTGAGLNALTESTCQFDRPSLELRCTHKYSDNHGTAITTVVTTKYGSLNEVLEEVKVNPPLRRSLWSATTQTSSRGAVTDRLENTYDTQGRLRSESSSRESTIYSEWDDAGRPTHGESRLGQSTVVRRMVYDLSSSITTTTTQQGSIVCKKTFDANGTELSSSCTGPGGSATTSSATITGTSRVCKAD
jgi:hypothetical protein